MKSALVSGTGCLLSMTKTDKNHTEHQNIEENPYDEPSLRRSRNNHINFYTWELESAQFQLLVLIFQGQFFSLHISTSGLQSPILFLFSLCLFLSDTLLGSPYWRWLCLPLPTALCTYIIQQSVCVSIQLDHRDMLFLPISFAPFRRLNNVCVSGTSTRLDAGGCRWESSVCQVCHQDDTIR